MHSTWSDGKASIREMAEAARARGYSYIAITDHSAYLGVTNGLDGARLKQQAAEIAALNAEYAARGERFRILRGVEVDITADGELALPDDVLAELDLVVASPHVSLRQPIEQATERLLRAIRNPHVDIIGHPTGRLIGSRAGSEIDLDAIGARRGRDRHAAGGQQRPRPARPGCAERAARAGAGRAYHDRQRLASSRQPALDQAGRADRAAWLGRGRACGEYVGC